jgi:hypothetical protein
VSLHYHIECVTCAKSSDNIGSGVAREVKALATEWPAIRDTLALIVRLAEVNLDSELHLGRVTYGFLWFMRSHADHQLTLNTEYKSDPPESLVVGGAPPVFHRGGSVIDVPALPDGMWVFVKEGKILASNFDTTKVPE